MTDKLEINGELIKLANSITVYPRGIVFKGYTGEQFTSWQNKICTVVVYEEMGDAVQIKWKASCKLVGYIPGPCPTVGFEKC